MNGMAVTYLQQGKLPEAHRWLDSAQIIADGSNYLQLKNVIYETERAYAEKVKDMDRLTEAQKKQDTVRSVLADRKDAFLNHTLEHLEDNYNKETRRGSYKNILILIAMIIIAGTISFLMVQRRQQKARFRKILERMREREVLRQHKIAQNTPVQETAKEVEHLVADKSAAPREPDAAMMTEETMQKILNSLEVFETGTLFNNRNMSLSFLASNFNTNTRYLSRVINHHKHKDFSSYINELRINYIVEKLKNDPVWRQYKISTLAEETGFSSHGKFTPVFKSITGLSPSLFIKYLEEEAQL
jgi:YesN/AraC family two-component response regulator